MRTRLAGPIVATLVGCSLLAACSRGGAPTQILTKPAPAALPQLPAGTGAWPFHPSARRQRFVVDQFAVITSGADSTIPPDTVSSHAEVAFTVAPGTVSGEVDVFLVKTAGRVAAPPAGLMTPFSLVASYPARGLQLAFGTPRETTTCSSTALAVAQSLRDLWFKPPDTLRTGISWEDSSTYAVCRDGIPLKATVRRVFRVSGTTEREGRVLLDISRTSRTAIEGTGSQFGEAVSVAGEGTGSLNYEFDPVSGEVAGAEGGATLDLSLHSRLRTQLVRQTVEIRIRRS